MDDNWTIFLVLCQGQTNFLTGHQLSWTELKKCSHFHPAEPRALSRHFYPVHWAGIFTLAIYSSDHETNALACSVYKRRQNILFLEYHAGCFCNFYYWLVYRYVEKYKNVTKSCLKHKKRLFKWESVKVASILTIFSKLADFNKQKVSQILITIFNG